MQTSVERPRPYGGQASIYDYEYRHYTDDIPFYLERLRHSGLAGPVLELGVGTGRVAIPLAEAGVAVTGVDLSVPMIARARRRQRKLPPEVADRLSFLRRDITKLTLATNFDLITAPFSTFNMLPSAEVRRQALDRAHAHTHARSRLILDVFAPLEAPGQARDATPPTRTQFFLPPYGHLIEKETLETYDPDHNLKQVIYNYDVRDHYGERRIRRFQVAFQLQVVSLAQLEAELASTGFEVLEVFGDYHGRPYGPRSGRLIVEAAPHF